MSEFTGIFYRGVPQQSTTYLFTPSVEGTWGSGLYLADYDAALIYADDGVVAECKVAMTNAYRHTCRLSHFEMYGERPAIALMKDIFISPDELIAKVVESQSFYFDSIIEGRLSELGHDGLIVTYEQDGSQEIITYRKTFPGILKIIEPESKRDFLPDFMRRHILSGLSIQHWLEELELTLDIPA